MHQLSQRQFNKFSQSTKCQTCNKHERQFLSMMKQLYANNEGFK